MHEGTKFAEGFTKKTWVSLVLWSDIKHRQTQIHIHITQRDQIQVHIEIYINAICYVLKGTIFIIRNE